jgi:hypothetical protein
VWLSFLAFLPKPDEQYRTSNTGGDNHQHFVTRPFYVDDVVQITPAIKAIC